MFWPGGKWHSNFSNGSETRAAQIRNCIGGEATQVTILLLTQRTCSRVFKQRQADPADTLRWVLVPRAKIVGRYSPAQSCTSYHILEAAVVF
jgi:hypothetical protein